MNQNLLKEFLDEKYLQYNTQDFIIDDPISIPHKFTKKEDIEIAAFFSSILAWGKRNIIIRNANKIVENMDMQPHDFILNHSKNDLKRFEGFVHRTFNNFDLMYFIESLNNIYTNYNGLEGAFLNEYDEGNKNMKESIIGFRKIFFEKEYLPRTSRHISNPEKNSAAKRLNMFLRWMVRKDNIGVDFGIWTNFSASKLLLPLDVHTQNTGRSLGLLTRKQSDWKAVEELTDNLVLLDPNDPVKYDFSLFGLGVYEDFSKTKNK